MPKRRPSRDPSPSVCRRPGSRWTNSRSRLTSQAARCWFMPIEKFRTVTEINLIAPCLLGLGDGGRHRAQPQKRSDSAGGSLGRIFRATSSSSARFLRLGNKGQISLRLRQGRPGRRGGDADDGGDFSWGALRHHSSRLHRHARWCGLWEKRPFNERIIPRTSLKRLIEPAEIADAICFMISNSAVSGSLWADAGYRPAA
jgi:3-oxoacyl-[acyl-carrier protein] reductase